MMRLMRSERIEVKSLKIAGKKCNGWWVFDIEFSGRCGNQVTLKSKILEFSIARDLSGRQKKALTSSIFKPNKLTIEEGKHKYTGLLGSFVVPGAKELPFTGVIVAIDEFKDN